MECFALITSIVSLLIAALALYYSILKPSRALIFPYLDEFELTPGSKQNNIALNLGGTIRFMIKNSGASSIFVDDISWQEEVIGIQNIRLELAQNSPERYMNGVTLKPYEHMPGSLYIGYNLTHQGQNINDLTDLLRHEMSRGKIIIKIKYTAYENKKVIKALKSFDITEKMKQFIF